MSHKGWASILFLGKSRRLYFDVSGPRGFEEKADVVSIWATVFELVREGQERFLRRGSPYLAFYVPEDV